MKKEQSEIIEATDRGLFPIVCDNNPFEHKKSVFRFKPHEYLTKGSNETCDAANISRKATPIMGCKHKGKHTSKVCTWKQFVHSHTFSPFIMDGYA